MDKIWIDYNDWLLKFCNFKQSGYRKLINQLSESPFEAILDRDLNRLYDGENLRRHFLSENGIHGDFCSHPVSILEVLIALAVRIDDEYTGNPNNPRPDLVFWEMICNLGLDKYDDKHYNYDEVYNILGIWIERKFDKNGVGSPFPVYKTYTDQRKIELWLQMTSYINIHFV